MSGVTVALQLREAVAADASRLARLAEQVGGRWDEAAFAGSLTGTARGWVMTAPPLGPPPADAALAAALSPALAAAVMVQPGPDDWEVLDLAVAPACQGQGLARHLLSQVQTAARAAGTQRLLLEVRAGNGRARQVYAAAGFGEIGRRLGYYAGSASAPIEDALVLALTL